VHTSAPR